MMLHRQTSAPVQPRFQGGKGKNQELNDRLRTKADELEKIFAEHKRRTYGDDMNENLVESDYVRGRFYERYMERRDLKLRKEWNVKREGREEMMKAIRESWEKSDAVMKAKIHRSSTKTSYQNQALANNLCEEESMKFSNISSRSVNSRTSLTKTSMSSSAGRNSNLNLNRAIPRPSAKSLTTSSIRTSSSNSPANYNITRSKSTSAGVDLFKDEKKPTKQQLNPKPAKPATERDSYSCITKETPRADIERSRKKWGSSQVSRIFHFGSKSKDAENSGRPPSFDGFSDGAIHVKEAQVNRIADTVTAANYKLKEEQPLRNGTPHSFFSLSSLRNQEEEYKLGR